MQPRRGWLASYGGMGSAPGGACRDLTNPHSSLLIPNSSLLIPNSLKEAVHHGVEGEAGGGAYAELGGDVAAMGDDCVD